MNSELTTPEALLALLRAGRPEDKLNVDSSTIKYALYARKSTPGEEKQTRSTGDQIADCIERVLTPLNIVPAQIIEEDFSAKESGTRTKFNALIEDIKSGRINGLIAWHPDRLARNMKDAGEIIDLLDKGTLRDLKFSTFTFENNPAGKMLLGLSFVLAKQYSEHLSENVLRGNRRYTEDAGEFLGKFKHGYYIDTNRHLIPDTTFTMVQRMFAMRLDERPQTEIRDWINSQDYKVRRRGQDPKPFVWDKDDVSKLLRDTTYAGILKWGDSSQVNLIEKYDFVPMITVQDFFKINKIKDFSAATVHSAITVKSGDIRANLLRGMVRCGACNETLTSMIIDKKNKYGDVVRGYYYYKCETPGCRMKNKGARAKLLIEAAKEFFGAHLFVTRENYDIYVADAKNALKATNIELEAEINGLKGQLSQRQQKYEQTKTLLLSNADLAEHYNLDALKAEEDGLRAKLDKLTGQRSRSKESIATYEQYLKLLQSAPVILGKIHDMDVMDALLRIFFLNFTIEPNTDGTFKGSQVLYKLKEPWDGFLKDGKFVDGAVPRSNFTRN